MIFNFWGQESVVSRSKLCFLYCSFLSLTAALETIPRRMYQEYAVINTTHSYRYNNAFFLVGEKEIKIREKILLQLTLPFCALSE